VHQLPRRHIILSHWRVRRLLLRTLHPRFLRSRLWRSILCPLPSRHCIRSISSQGQLQRLSPRHILINHRVIRMHQLPCWNFLIDCIRHLNRRLFCLRFRRSVACWE
jgi:hypothetical protein